MIFTSFYHWWLENKVDFVPAGLTVEAEHLIKLQCERVMLACKEERDNEIAEMEETISEKEARIDELLTRQYDTSSIINDTIERLSNSIDDLKSRL